MAYKDFDNQHPLNQQPPQAQRGKGGGRKNNEEVGEPIQLNEDKPKQGQPDKPGMGQHDKPGMGQREGQQGGQHQDKR